MVQGLLDTVWQFLKGPANNHHAAQQPLSGGTCSEQWKLQFNKNLAVYVCSSFIHNSPKLETAQMLFNGWTVKRCPIHTMRHFPVIRGNRLFARRSIHTMRRFPVIRGSKLLARRSIHTMRRFPVIRGNRLLARRSIHTMRRFPVIRENRLFAQLC